MTSLLNRTRSRLSLYVCMLCVFAVLVVLISGDRASAQTATLKTLDDHFPFVVPESVDAWRERSDSLRRRVQVANGLWPMPEKTTITPVLHGKLEREGFTVEKVYFESLPGHFVSGMLFRPSADNRLGIVDGKRPAVLCPHGHGGRTMRLDDQELQKQLASGAEVFEHSGRYPKLARCAHLARMGCVSFIFDMLGYADSVQIEFEVAHRHAQPRPEEADRSAPCFFSIDADLNLQSIMGLQTWNAIRALDFLVQLPDVDALRLGVTGGSGGGTQTILLGALDPRITVGFPNGMVSTSMQGGCYCENCNYLRIDTGNVELAALFAPRPQGMTAANDWTKAMLQDGYPELQRLYAMLGVKENVMCGDVLRFPHNYNAVSRSMMYPWMAKHLELPSDSPLVEKDFQPFSEAEMSVWDAGHPAPDEVGIPHERKVLAWWKKQSDQQLQALVPAGGESSDATANSGDSNTNDSAKRALDQYRRVIGGAWSVIFDRSLPAASELVVQEINHDRGQKNVVRYEVRHPAWNTTVQIDVASDHLVGDGGYRIMPTVAGPDVAGLAAGVKEVLDSRSEADPERAGLSVDVHLYPALDGAGNAASNGDRQPLIADKRSYSGFTFGYNRTLAVKRFEQLMCAVTFLKSRNPDAKCHLISDRQDCVSSAAVAAIAGQAIDTFVINTEGFRIASVTSYADKDFVPGAAKYFDLPGLLSLRAPYSLTIRGETEASMPLVKQIYSAASATEQLHWK